MKKQKPINVRIGRNIQRERERAGLTQEKLSEMIDIASTSLSSIERGVMGASLTTLEKICTVLSVSADALLFGRTQENDAAYLAERLGRLTPEQFRIANSVLTDLLEAFRLD